VDGVFDEGVELIVVFREDAGFDRVNCQLYSGWRLGKCKPGVQVITDGEELVEAAGLGIEIWCVGFSGGVGVGACEGNGASVVDFCDKALRQ